MSAVYPKRGGAPRLRVDRGDAEENGKMTATMNDSTCFGPFEEARRAGSPGVTKQVIVGPPLHISRMPGDARPAQGDDSRPLEGGERSVGAPAVGGAAGIRR